MAKKVKQKVQLVEGIDPGLFGQKYLINSQKLQDSLAVLQSLKSNSSTCSIHLVNMLTKVSPTTVCCGRTKSVRQ